MADQRVDTTRLQRFARAYCETAVFYAALDLELFTHIAHGANTEEKLMVAKLGDDYLDYMNKTSKWIPRIGRARREFGSRK